jgi:hypothetical protein
VDVVTGEPIFTRHVLAGGAQEELDALVPFTGGAVELLCPLLSLCGIRAPACFLPGRATVLDGRGDVRRLCRRWWSWASADGRAMQNLSARQRPRDGEHGRTMESTSWGDHEKGWSLRDNTAARQ